jgi:hypothetical protein
MRSTKQPSPQMLTQVERVRQRFERWRRTRKKRSRIPEQLWHAAVGVAASYGVNPTARTLGLDYYELKKRLESGGDASAVEQVAVGRFVELVSPVTTVGAECLVELERAGGTKMRIHLQGAPDVGLLRELFWGGEE